MGVMVTAIEVGYYQFCNFITCDFPECASCFYKFLLLAIIFGLKHLPPTENACKEQCSISVHLKDPWDDALLMERVSLFWTERIHYTGKYFA